MAEKPKREIEIGTIREWTVITPEGKFKVELEIPYTIDDIEYSLRIDKEGSTPESIEKAVRADALKIIESKGKKITI